MSAQLNYKPETKSNYIHLSTSQPVKTKTKWKLFISKYEDQLAVIQYFILMVMAVFILTHI